MGVSGIDGFRVLATSLAVQGVTAQRKVASVFAKTANDIERDARTLAPVDTGNLRSSISHTTSLRGGMIRVEIGPTANYGGFLETGTSVMAPQPYMGPALDRRTPGFLKGMEQAATPDL